MAAPIENKNAEVWTLDKRDSVLEDIIRKIKKKDIQYLGELNTYFNVKHGGSNYICKKLKIFDDIKNELKKHPPNRKSNHNSSRGCKIKHNNTTNNYIKNKLKTNNEFRLRFNFSSLFRYHFKNKKGGSTFEILGYSVFDLKNHLQAKFDKNMNWDNYGSYWHIDHIKPASLFNHENTNELKKCWELDNLQPLEAIENMRKGNRYYGE